MRERLLSKFDLNKFKQWYSSNPVDGVAMVNHENESGFTPSLLKLWFESCSYL